MAALQAAAAIVATVSGLRGRRKRGGILVAMLGAVALLGAVGGWMLGVLVSALDASGGAWGRPLRIRGRRRHPELALAGLGAVDDPLRALVYETVTDGCQLEDFNADVAARCAAVCEEPVTRALLDQIAREERSHADFSWALVEWVLGTHPARARAAMERALGDLAGYPRPTPVSGDKRALVARADEAALRRHGRLRDEEWAEAWTARLGETRRRIVALLGAAARRAA